MKKVNNYSIQIEKKKKKILMKQKEFHQHISYSELSNCHSASHFVNAPMTKEQTQFAITLTQETAK